MAAVVLQASDEWPEPGTTIDDSPPGTPIGSDDTVSRSHEGSPPQPGEIAGTPHAPDAEAIDDDAAKTADTSQRRES